MNAQDREEKARIVTAALATLSEHFEAVQILCSHCDSTGTAKFFLGSGNYYARTGMARQFIAADQNLDLAAEIARQTTEDD